MSLIRWWKETRTPALKCDRLGHVPGFETRTGYKSAKYSWHVLDKVHQERPCCRRCGQISGDWVTVDRTGFNSVSWPSEMWDEYYANGCERWTDIGWRSAP
jgi:hypothetical protein